MSKRPTNENIPQHLLWNVGAKDMGTDLVNVSKDSEVRMHGLKKLGRYAGGLALAAGVIAGGVALTEYAYDHSPTVVYQQHLQQEYNPPQLPVTPPPTIPSEKNPINTAPDGPGGTHITPDPIQVDSAVNPATPAGQ